MKTLTALVLVIVGLLPGHAVTNSQFDRLTPLINAQPPTPQPAYQPLVIPLKIGGGAPQLSAASAYVLDEGSGLPLYTSHGDTQRPIASITKLATALVIARKYQPSQIITVPMLPTYDPADEVIGLQAGEQLSVHDLLAALLINSADDAADALGIASAGSSTQFATEMNQLMVRWGIANAHFSNPSGLTDVGNGASAAAVAQIAKLALANTSIKQLVATPNLTIHDIAGRSFGLTTTDQLLQGGQFQGIKTGYTPAAGNCFVGLTTIQGHQVITVVLGSQDRFGDTQRLADWINTTYRWQ